MKPIPIASRSAESVSSPFTSERLLNMFPEPAEGTAKSTFLLRSFPGLTQFADIAQSVPMRLLHKLADVPYAVISGTVYSIDEDGEWTALPGPTIGDGSLSAASSGTQMVIVNGTTGYVVEDGAVTAITDPDYLPATWVEWMDRQFIFGRANSDEFFISAIGDAHDIDPLDFASAERQPDATLRGVVSHGELWLFGTDTTEIWVNTGDEDFPFQRLGSGIIEEGIIAPGAVAKGDNTIFKIGNDRKVYRHNQYSPVRISTHALETKIRGYEDISDARMFVYDLDGHKFLVLNFPSAEKTHVIDIATGSTFDLSSFRDDVDGNWRGILHVHAYDKHLVGDDEVGAIWQLDPEVHTDGGGVYRRQFVTPPLHSNGERVTMWALQLDIETGVGLTTGQGSDPQVMMRYSDDGGRTWSNERWADMGPIGAYRTRAVWLRLGQFRERMFEFTVTDPVPFRAMAAYGDWS